MKKKSLWAFIAASALCLCLVYAEVSAPVTAANIRETDSEIKVLIGSSENMSAAALKRYSDGQEAALSRFAETEPESVGSALVAFNRFLTVEETDQLIDGARASTVYLWVPNQQGRAIIDVQNNDIQASIDDFFRSIELPQQPASDMKNSLLDLEKNYSVFAVEIDSQYSRLQDLASSDTVARLDLLYSQEAIQRASATGKTVSYICLPDKPDGTL